MTAETALTDRRYNLIKTLPRIRWLSFHEQLSFIGPYRNPMNHDPEPLPASPRFVLAALLVFLLAGNGCGRKEAPSAPSSPGPTEAGNTPSLSPNPAIVSAEK